MLKWTVHLSIAAVGIAAFVLSDINSTSLLNAAVYPLVMWVAIIYAIAVGVTEVFGWPGPTDRTASGVDFGSTGISHGDSGGSTDGD